MGLLLHNTSETPPGYWRYLVPETGRRFPDPKLDPGKHYYAPSDLMNDLNHHYKANGLEVPADLFRRVQDQLCLLLPPDRCYYENASDRPVVARFHVTFDKVVAGTKSLIGWQMKGRPKASVDTINERSAVCVRCPYNVLPAGCATCNSPLVALVNAFVGSSKGKHDASIHSCAVCGCALKALVQMPTEIIQEHLSQEQKAALPDYCWQK